MSKMHTLARKCGLRLHTIGFGMFEFDMTLAVGPGKRLGEFVRWYMDDSKFEWEHEKQRGMHFNRRGYCPIVWLPRRPRTPREYGTLAHEVSHVVRHMLQDWTDIPHTRDTDETYAHAISHAVTAALTKMAT